MKTPNIGIAEGNNCCKGTKTDHSSATSSGANPTKGEPSHFINTLIGANNDHLILRYG